MASVILCGTPATLCDEFAPTNVVNSITAGASTLTGAITLTATGDAVLSVSAPQTININVPTPPTPSAQTPTFLGAPQGLGAQNALATNTGCIFPLTWSATLAGILDPTGPAPPAGSGVYLDMTGFQFYCPVNTQGTIEAQLTDNVAINEPALSPLNAIDTAVAGTSVGVGSIMIDALGLHNSGMPVGAGAVYLRLFNSTPNTINLVSYPAEVQTIYYPSVAP